MTCCLTHNFGAPTLSSCKSKQSQTRRHLCNGFQANLGDVVRLNVSSLLHGLQGRLCCWLLHGLRCRLCCWLLQGLRRCWCCRLCLRCGSRKGISLPTELLWFQLLAQPAGFFNWARNFVAQREQLPLLFSCWPTFWFLQLCPQL